MEWISVEKRMPEPFHTVLFSRVCINLDRVFHPVLQGYVTDDNEWVSYLWSEVHTDVTHWMPNPEPPK